jgi:hypothetical protein
MDKKHKELLAACGEDKPIEELVALVKRHVRTPASFFPAIF